MLAAASLALSSLALARPAEIGIRAFEADDRESNGRGPASSGRAAGPAPGRAGAGSATPDALARGDNLVPPRLTRNSPARYPPALAAERVEGEVWLDLVINPDGSVGEAKLLRGVHPLLDQSALAAALDLGFEPATLDGVPVPVRIQFSYRFVAPPRVITPEKPPTGVLTGLVRARGTRRPVPGASIVFGDELGTVADEDGRFEIELPVGAHRARVRAPGFHAAEYKEEIRTGERLEVVYSIEPRQLNPYETIVRAERDRTEVARVSLNRQEVHEVPGTMGDPFRVVMLMPGVGSFLSGVAYPVVRGSAPASSGYYLDGVRVPILFHLFLGPAVIHPDFVEGIDFFPGAPPARFGRLMGGVIDGRTKSPTEPGLHASAYADVINTGAFVEYPFEATGTRVSLAGRFSYAAWLAALAASALQEPAPAGSETPSFVLDFWDYQGRVEQQIGPGTLRLFGFGSSDRMGTTADSPDVATATQAILFHRVDLRWRGPLAGGEVEAGAVWGIDKLAFESQGLGRSRTYFGVEEGTLGARLGWSSRMTEGLELRLGGDLDRRQARVIVGRTYDGSSPMASLRGPQSLGTFAGSYGELVWKPGDSWTVIPGLRADSYHLAPGIQHWALEPRLTVRHSLLDNLVLKGAAGLYHQHPITLIHVPVVDLAGLEMGIQRALQFDVGAEWTVFDGIEINADVYFNPLLRTVELNPFDADALNGLKGTPISSSDLEDPQALLRGGDVSSTGYAYGFELMLRRPLGGNWFGWISYSLQRSTRWTEYSVYDKNGAVTGRASGYLPYAFDQTHIVNAVLSLKLGNWTLGTALHFNTGRPETGVMTSSTMRESRDPQGREAWVRVGHQNADRLPPFFRADVRVAHTWAFETFLLEAYLDVLNISFTSEIVGFSYTGGTWGGGGPLEKVPEGFPVVLPVLGVKGSY
ncbi:MAG: TonB family protein [Myxococcales bacterium]|jgi:TonB family protein